MMMMMIIGDFLNSDSGDLISDELVAEAIN
jgi:hypothetical protein